MAYKRQSMKPHSRPRKNKYVRSANVRRNSQLDNKIQAVINANLENKEAYKSISTISYNSGIDNSSDLSFVVPSITTGVGDNARIGDQLRAQRLTIRGHINTLITGASYTTAYTARIGVRMMIVQPKSYVGYDSIYNSAATWLGTLLKKGASTVGFTGIVSDLYAPINTDSITKYYDRTFYMNSPFVMSAVGDCAIARSTKFFTIRMKLRNKKLLYDNSNNSGLSPTNYNPVLIIGYSHLDGSPPDVVNTQILLNYDSIMDYQDA